MNKEKTKQAKKKIRQKRVRAKISGNAKRPRLCVSKTNNSIYLQLIDDERGKTLASAHSREIKKKKLTKTQNANELGRLIAKKAADKKIKSALFDRSGCRYHGRVKAAAEGAREGGLEF